MISRREWQGILEARGHMPRTKEAFPGGYFDGDYAPNSFQNAGPCIREQDISTTAHVQLDNLNVETSDRDNSSRGMDHDTPREHHIAPGTLLEWQQRREPGTMNETRRKQQLGPSGARTPPGVHLMQVLPTEPRRPSATRGDDDPIMPKTQQ